MATEAGDRSTEAEQGTRPEHPDHGARKGTLVPKVEGPDTPMPAAATPGAPASPDPARRDPVTREAGSGVGQDQAIPGVSGRLQGLLSKDSPYLARARTGAAQAANRRGLLNSSIASGAGEAAAIDAALPIATADADIASRQRTRP